jgi:hypothetical protein
MNPRTLLALICFSLLAPSLFGQAYAPAASTNTTTPAPIPEEARKHFVMGTTLFKDAKTADDFLQVTNEFKQATDLAPQWSEARYNLALAREAAGDYSGAIDDLKIYQQFKLSDAEARTVQDKIYTLEAKQLKKVSSDAAKAATDSANASAAADAKKNDFIKSIQGNWGNGNPSFPINISISPPENGNTNVAFSASGQNLAVSNIIVTESTLQFTVDMVQSGDPETLYHYNLSLNSNGRLAGSLTESLTESGKAMIRQAGYTPAGDSTQDCFFSRQ